MTNLYRSNEIADLYTIFENAVAESDVDVLLSKFYTPDVIFAGTDLPLSQGQVVNNVLKGLCGAVESASVEQLQTLVVEPGKVMIDFAIIHAQGKDGTAIKDRSTCVFQNGPHGWRCVADIFIRD